MMRMYSNGALLWRVGGPEWAAPTSHCVSRQFQMKITCSLTLLRPPETGHKCPNDSALARPVEERALTLSCRSARLQCLCPKCVERCVSEPHWEIWTSHCDHPVCGYHTPLSSPVTLVYVHLLAWELKKVEGGTLPAPGNSLIHFSKIEKILRQWYSLHLKIPLICWN